MRLAVVVVTGLVGTVMNQVLEELMELRREKYPERPNGQILVCWTLRMANYCINFFVFHFIFEGKSYFKKSISFVITIIMQLNVKSKK